MEQFVVSARKYRPAEFDEVVGQKHITDTLLNEINNNTLAHAFLFTGPRGVGKTTCARILAKLINRVEGQPDITDLSYNVFELDAASNNGVDDIRALTEQVSYAPAKGKFKVYIIDEVHMLSTSAFNAFLKTLEEPHEHAIFILATTERHKILPTILSRCQIFNFKKIQVADMVEHLKKIAEKEQVTIDEDSLHLIAEKADGGLRDCLSIFDQMASFCNKNITFEKAAENLNILDRDFYFKMTDNFYTQNVGQALVEFDEIIEKGFDGLTFLNGLNEHIRNLMVCKLPETSKLLEVSESFKLKFKEQAEKIDMSFLLNALNINNQYEIEYKASKNQRLHVELAIIKLCHIRSVVKSAITLEELKKKVMNS